MKKQIFAAIFAVALLSSCKEKQNYETWVIASDQADCVGVAPQKCLLVKRAGEQNWQFFYDGIDDFTYEPGYEYTIHVRPENRNDLHQAADRSTIRYKLVKQVDKIKRESENLPIEHRVRREERQEERAERREERREEREERREERRELRENEL